MPVMSAGIRSGVNWIRWNRRWKTWAIVRTSRVLASPGAPVIRQWPPAKRLMRSWWVASRWPTITLASSRSIRPRLSWIFSTTWRSSSKTSTLSVTVAPSESAVGSAWIAMIGRAVRDRVATCTIGGQWVMA